MRSTLDQEDVHVIVAAVIDGLRPLLSDKKKNSVDDSIFDVPGLCEYLHVTPKWIHSRSHLKEIPYYKLSNKQLRFRKRDIDKWLDSLKTPAINEYRGKLNAVR